MIGFQCELIPLLRLAASSVLSVAKERGPDTLKCYSSTSSYGCVYTPRLKANTDCGPWSSFLWQARNRSVCAGLLRKLSPQQSLFGQADSDLRRAVRVYSLLEIFRFAK